MKFSTVIEYKLFSIFRVHVREETHTHANVAMPSSHEHAHTNQGKTATFSWIRRESNEMEGEAEGTDGQHTASGLDGSGRLIYVTTVNFLKLQPSRSGDASSLSVEREMQN